MAQNRIRNKGSYAPLSAHYYKDDAIDMAGPEAELLYVRGLAFCADVLSDGYISDRQLLRFVGVGLEDVQARADALVDARLWERDDNIGGYWVRSWLEWNRSRDEITDYQVKDAARKRRPEPEKTPDDPPPTPPRGTPETSERTPNGLPPESVGRPERSPEGIQPRARTPLHSNSTPTPENTLPLAELAEPDPSPPPIDPLVRFNEFWAAFPRRLDRRAAEKAWRAAMNRGADPNLVISAARGYAVAKLSSEKRYIKHPATWLNAGAYDNEHEPAPDWADQARGSRTRTDEWQALKRSSPDARTNLRAITGGEAC